MIITIRQLNTLLWSMPCMAMLVCGYRPPASVGARVAEMSNAVS